MTIKFRMIENSFYRYYNHEKHHGMFFHITYKNNRNIFLDDGTIILFLKEGKDFVFFFYNGKIIYTDNVYNSFIKEKMYIPVKIQT